VKNHKFEDIIIAEGARGERLVEIDGKLELVHIYTMTVELETDNPRPVVLLINPDDFEDVLEWDVNVTGNFFQERATSLAKEKRGKLSFGEITLYISSYARKGIVTMTIGNKVGFLVKKPVANSNT
jgi:hypothetical protein